MSYTPMPGESGLVEERQDNIAILRFSRPAKRNAVNDATILHFERFFDELPEDVGSVVLTADGEHFCAGLDLTEHRKRTASETMYHSRLWHRVLEKIQFSRVPVISAMKGAVIGGGLEIATSTHVRVSDDSCFFALPEAVRGIYVGGGASVRVANIIGAGRMAEMMLTGNVFDAKRGFDLGLSHHLVEAGGSEAKALELAEKVAGNAGLSNFAIIHALPRMYDMPSEGGFLTESLMAGLAHTSEDAQNLLEEFLSGRAPRVKKD